MSLLQALPLSLRRYCWNYTPSGSLRFAFKLVFGPKHAETKISSMVPSVMGQTKAEHRVGVPHTRAIDHGCTQVVSASAFTCSEAPNSLKWAICTYFRP